MKNSKEIRVAERQIKEHDIELSKTSSELPAQSVDKQVMHLGERFQYFLKDSEMEQELEEVEVAQLRRHDVLKRKLIHLYISGVYNVRQMASIIGVRPNTIYKWLREKDVNEEIQKYQLEEDAVVTSALKALRLRAVDKQAELLDADNEMVQALTARDILDRTGHKAVEKKETSIHVTYEQKIAQLLGKPNEVPADYTVHGDSQEIETEGE
jgi:transposase-like protein